MAVEKLLSDKIVGCLLAFVSAMAFACVGMFFKLIEGMYFTQVVLYRLAATTLVVIPIYWRCSEQPLIGDFEQNKWVSLVGVGHAINFPIKFLALSLASYADMFALKLSGVMLSTLLIGKFWLKETCGVFETITAGVIMTGMLLITNPVEIINFLTSEERTGNWTALEEIQYNSSSDSSQENMNFTIISQTNEVHNRVIAVTITLVECFVHTGVILCARKAKVHYSILTLHVSFWAATSCTVITFLFGYFSLPTSLNQLLHLLGFTLCGTIFVCSHFQALLYQEAGVVSTIRTSEIPTSYALQAVFLQAFPTLLVMLGSTIITVATVVFGLVTWRRGKKTEEYQEFQE